ncbi:HET-domain-containing protein [Stemphylium lycopersici]|uniref:HET-domain-containing protein n=1 Tax=Stemphylium lycopersici TaxID=183478 RepID=A0A364N029_STELY|nr:ankyrin and het domain-containing protein [Stemphylium lycopersici]RAR00774.1 HET-domain-containing protein [Stemphylium lycopersici]RAR08217.1 HET-domain-containing protein [Stemphylium lycopersici]
MSDNFLFSCLPPLLASLFCCSFWEFLAIFRFWYPKADHPSTAPAPIIRVARIWPGAYDDKIEISSHYRHLVVDEARRATDHYFEYEALSYAWGSKDGPSHVHVREYGNRECEMQFTRNLDEALRHVRKEHEPRLVWIDALCINQSDDTEKGFQVAMMGEIYRLADCVIAWLGPEGDGSEAAFDLMREWICELSSKTLDLPSWVPDWSSRINTFDNPYASWSACGWISAQAAILDENRLRVTGMKCAQITEVFRYERDSSWYKRDMVELLRKLRPYVEFEEDDVVAEAKKVQRLSRCFAGDSFSEDFLPVNFTQPILQDVADDIRTIWSTEKDATELEDELIKPETWIDRNRFAMRDTETQELHTDLVAILEKAGIKVESYQRRPHRLEVLPETLKAAGAPLEDFILV